MKFEREWLIEVIGVSAVIISLLFVAYQIRQSNRIAMGVTSYELNRNWMDINDLYLTNPDVLNLSVALQSVDYEPKGEIEKQVAMAYARRLLNNWMSIEEAFENGVASEDLYETARSDVESVIRKRPALVPIYEAVFENYNVSEYRLLEPIRKAIVARNL